MGSEISIRVRSTEKLKAFQLCSRLFYAFTWIRKDWLDKLGLEEPGSCWKNCRRWQAFVEEDLTETVRRTIGLLCDRQVGGLYNSNHTMDPVFSWLLSPAVAYH